jgi:hypothetical protein
MELEKNLKRLIKYYKKDSVCQEKINNITKFVINDISIYEEELEDTYNRYFDSTFKLYSKYIKLICKYIVAGNIKKIKIEVPTKGARNKEKIEDIYEIEGFDKLTIAEETIVNDFIILIYSYLIGNIDFDSLKTFIFIESHDINYNDFTNINKRAAFALCNMKDNGINLKQFANLGNVQLEFIDSMSSGKYGRESDIIANLNTIAINIDHTFKTNEMNSLDINDMTFIFTKQLNKVYIYDSFDMSKNILTIDDENNFYGGTFASFIPYLRPNTDDAEIKESNETSNQNIEEDKEESKEDLMNQMAEIMAKLQDN